MQKLMEQMEQLPQVNILLLGQTGVGKSTWINALRNYLEYATLREAMAGGVKVLIPSKFMQGGTTVLVGEPDSQEASTESGFLGQSSTQSCRSHYFAMGDRNIQIIDTPGIGDVRGLAQDKQNTDHILQYLKKEDHLHGICILLKPNESRLTPEFKFCLTSLLTNLHKHAANNIMFCYTNTRATLYSYGDTDGLIRQMLSGLNRDHGHEIPYDADNTFFFDSESFRLLACIEHGMVFPTHTVDAFSGSWSSAVEETFRLLMTISRARPHVVAETVSLNDARKLITLLSRPLAEIANTVTGNIAKIDLQRERIKETTNDEDQLHACLWREIEVLETSALPYPRTVCTAQQCISIVDSIVEYSTICHDHCYLNNVPHDTIGHPALAKCRCMDSTGICHVGDCRCPWALHQHITYNTRRVQTRKKDESVAKQIRNKRSTKEIVKSTMSRLAKDIQELEEEKKKISIASARFAVFLKENAITPFNDSIDQYLEYMIEQRRNMNEMVVVRGLEKLRKEYQEEKKLYKKGLAESLSSSSSPSGPTTRRPLWSMDVPKVLAELVKLPISGKSLREQMDASLQCMAKFDTHRRASTSSRPKLTNDRPWLLKQSARFKNSFSTFFWATPSSGPRTGVPSNNLLWPTLQSVHPHHSAKSKNLCLSPPSSPAMESNPLQIVPS